MNVNGEERLSDLSDEQIADIASLAYQIYLESGCVDGRHLEHWAEAERRIAGKQSAQGGEAGASVSSRPTAS